MSRKFDCLSDREKTDYAEGMGQIAGELIEKIIDLADKYDIDRDYSVEHFASVLNITASVGTFQKYK